MTEYFRNTSTARVALTQQVKEAFGRGETEIVVPVPRFLQLCFWDHESALLRRSADADLALDPYLAWRWSAALNRTVFQFNVGPTERTGLPEHFDLRVGPEKPGRFTTLAEVAAMLQPAPNCWANGRDEYGRRVNRDTFRGI